MNGQGISWKTQLRTTSDISIKDSGTFYDFTNKL